MAIEGWLDEDCFPERQEHSKQESKQVEVPWVPTDCVRSYGDDTNPQEANPVAGKGGLSWCVFCLLSRHNLMKGQSL